MHVAHGFIALKGDLLALDDVGARDALDGSKGNAAHLVYQLGNGVHIEREVVLDLVALKNAGYAFNHVLSAGFGVSVLRVGQSQVCFGSEEVLTVLVDIHIA